MTNQAASTGDVSAGSLSVHRCVPGRAGYLCRKWTQEVSVYKPFFLKVIATAAFYCLPKQ